MQIVYGFNPNDPLDLTGVNRLFDTTNLGTPKLSATFVMDPAAQLALLEDCALLRESDIVKPQFIATTQTNIKLSFCWVEAFKLFRMCRGLSFPVPVDATEALLHWVGQGPDPDCPEEAWSHGRSSQGDLGGYRFDMTGDLGWVSDATGVKLGWARVRADSLIMERAYFSAATLRVHYDKWEALVATLNLDAPTSLGPAMQISSKSTTSRDNKWLHMLLQETYVKMALTGVGIGLSIALVVLVVATMNVIVATLSILSIAGALCWVIGLIVARGWQLGSAESLSMMILTGFAVDYVVHLSHAYMESNKVAPVDRVHDALRDLGISVFWGMLTSVIAAGVLSTLQLQFFSKFGTFFLYTIICAYLWAVLFLMPLLAFVGPRGVGPHAVEEQSQPHMVSA
jgi:hypothetical protein